MTHEFTHDFLPTTHDTRQINAVHKKKNHTYSVKEKAHLFCDRIASYKVAHIAFVNICEFVRSRKQFCQY